MEFLKGLVMNGKNIEVSKKYEKLFSENGFLKSIKDWTLE